MLVQFPHHFPAIVCSRDLLGPVASVVAGCCGEGSMGAVGGRRITASEVKFLDRGKTAYSAGIFQVCLR
jgi:hypothetical protein